MQLDILDRNVGVCSTMRANRDIPHDVEGEGMRLKKGQSAFRRKGDVMLQVWRVKRLVQMISMILEVTIVNTGRIDGKSNLEMRKPYAIVQNSTFMKGIDWADKCLSFYSVLWKTVKW
jgi:hypothetical protein